MSRDAYDMFSDRADRGRFGDNESSTPRPRVTGASNLVDLAMVLHVDRPAAVLVSSSGDIQRAVWLPKSQIEIELTGPLERKHSNRTIQACTVTLPSWLAKEKGLV